MVAIIGALWRGGNHAVAGQAASPRHFDSVEKAATPRSQNRQYRADAAILILGITIFRIRGVGGGQASTEESGDGASKTRTLFFAAGSDPARAHGLNRLGWIREVVRETNSIPVELQYFGVLTASPEESLEHARKSISTPAASHNSYSAVSGRNTPGNSRSAITHFDLAAGAKWSDKVLIDAAQSTFQEKVAWRETSWPDAGSQPPPTFLFELATLLGQRARQASGRYVYNEQEYLMELDAPQIGKAGGNADALRQVHGKIRNQRTGGLTNFTVWMEEGSIVPMRIEYQPRAFLRLVFEGVAA
jgi:hypothetical protein